ncbi:MAG: hypothetical protein HY360_25825 [Verrucomicrobia bacterium]|nr:hypothetical protein [Verrucomicrobiota bacterium]
MNPRETKYYRQGLIHGQGQRAVGRNYTDLVRRTLAETLDLPVDEAVRRTVADYQERLEALPSLTQYPELRGMRGCVVAYNLGMAEGADLTLHDAMLQANFLNMITEAFRFNPNSEVQAAIEASLAAEPGCTLVYFPCSDRGPLVANNRDGTYQPGHRQEEPTPIIANRAGLVVGCVSNGIFDDEVSPERFPVPVDLMAYEMCGTTDEAIDLYTRLNPFWGSRNQLIADCKGNSAVIEKSTCRCGLRKSANGFSATTEMSAEEPVFKAYLWETREQSLQRRGLDHHSADWTYWKTCERRSARLLRLMDEAKGAPTFAKLERIIYDHTGQPEQIHMDGTKCHPKQKDGEWSLRTTIWILNERRAFYSFAEPPVSSHLTPRLRKDFPPVEMIF